MNDEQLKAKQEAPLSELLKEKLRETRKRSGRMTVASLIEALQKLDPDKLVYVPHTSHISPVCEPRLTETFFKDGEGVLLCAIDAKEEE